MYSLRLKSNNMCNHPFSALESIGCAALALLAGWLSQPNVVAVLEWLGYTVNSPEDQYRHDVMLGVGMAICGVLALVSFLLYSTCLYNTVYYRGLNNRDVRNYRRREDGAGTSSDSEE